MLRFPQFVRNKKIVFPKVQNQDDTIDCEVFAIAFATTIATGGNPEETSYCANVTKLREHLLNILTSEELTEFPHN